MAIRRSKQCTQPKDTRECLVTSRPLDRVAFTAAPEQLEQLPQRESSSGAVVDCRNHVARFQSGFGGRRVRDDGAHDEGSEIVALGFHE